MASNKQSELYKRLTKHQEDMLISFMPNEYFRDDKEPVLGMDLSLIGGDDGCNHLSTLSGGGGVHCVKCGAWFCF